jgi:hypothetical protein
MKTPYSKNVTIISGTYSHSSNTNEQIILTITVNGAAKLVNLWLDLSALTQLCTIKVYSKIDSSNYVEVPSMQLSNVDAASRKGMLLKEMTIDTDWKITLTSGTAEGASRNIPYRYYMEIY